MHLIVFPLIAYLLAAAPILLLWEGRGLNQRNYWLAIAGSMLGLFLGFGLLLLLVEIISTIFLALLMFVGFPVSLAAAAVQFFGVNADNYGSPEPQKNGCGFGFFSAFFAAVLVGFIPLSLMVWMLGIDVTHLFLGMTLLLPLSACAALIQFKYRKPLTTWSILKRSLVLSVLILSASMILGPYFILGLPLVAYVFASSWVFLYASCQHIATER